MPKKDHAPKKDHVGPGLVSMGVTWGPGLVSMRDAWGPGLVRSIVVLRPFVSAGLPLLLFEPLLLLTY